MNKRVLISSAAPVRAVSAPAMPRRKRASGNARVRVSHVVIPGHELKGAEAVAGERISEFLTRHDWSRQERVGKALRWQWSIPTICLVNGKPLLQRQWKRRRIKPTDEVAFVSRPHGGGGRGKQIAGIVAAIALAAFLPGIGTALGGSIIGAVATAAIAVGGSLLISALFRPKPASESNSDAADQVSQIYTVQAGGNTARPLAPIPVQYGRLKIIPDYASMPFSEYEGNDQYLNLLLARGLGKYEVEQVMTDDTEIWNSVDGVSDSFPGVEVAHYDPGEDIDLFPTNIVTSVEVSGQTIEDSFLGGYIANASGTQANALSIDLVFPGGCFKIIEGGTEQGKLESNTAVVLAEARPVDNAGSPQGSFTTLLNETYTFTTRNPIRLTKKVEVAPGRYEVRVRRTNADQNERGTSAVAWAGLRSYIVDAPSSYPCSITALRIQASAFTQDAARRIGVVQTRILPVWDSELETWVEQPTRNPWWAFYDAATNDDYGPRRPVSTLDSQTIFTRAAAADLAERAFDYQFVATVPVPEAFDTILKADRSRHRWSGDRLTAVRDEFREFPRMLLTDREIIRGTVDIDYALQPEDSADCVILEYLDEETWRAAEVQYPPNSESFTAEKPARLRIDGIVDRDIAYEEAALLYLQNVYRRVFVTLQTEHDGKLLGYGDTLRIQTELPNSWGQSGAILNRVGNRLTVDREIDWTADGDVTQFYIAIRTKTGRQFGPVKCSEVGGSPSEIAINGTDLATVESQQAMTLAEALSRSEGAEEPSFEIGVGTKRARNCLVLSGRPNGDRVTLGLVVNSTDAYPTDLSGLPAIPELPALRDPKVPLIYQLYASFRQGVAEPVLEASWWPAAGAQYYRADVSYDDGLNWAPVYEGISTGLSVVVDRAALRLRVQGVGAERRGPYSTLDLEAPQIEIAPNSVSLESLQAGLKDYVQTQLTSALSNISFNHQRIAALAAEQDAANALDKRTVRQILAAQNVTISETAAIALGIEGNLEAAYWLTIDNDGYVTGLQLYNGGPGTSEFTVVADKFLVAQPGESGGDPKAVFAIANVGGTPTLVIAGNMIADGTITAAKIAAGTITANEIAANTITAGKIVAATITATEILSGSATAMVDAVGSNRNSNGGAVSITFTAVTGNIVIMYSCDFIGAEFHGDNPSDGFTHDVDIKIDGVSVGTREWIETSRDTLYSRGNQGCTFILRKTVSAGSRTIVAAVSSVYSIKQWYTPTLVVLESRR